MPLASCCMQFPSLLVVKQTKTKMNFNAILKKNFIKYDNVEKLHFELANIVNLAANTDHIFYCYYKELIACCCIKRKCTLCEFCSLFFSNHETNNMSIEELLLRNRKNETELLRLVDLFWPYLTKMRLFKPDALDFFKQEYKWSFRDYRNHMDLSMTLQEVIHSTEELIELNGEEVVCRFKF